MPIPAPLSCWTSSFADGCAPSCASRKSGRALLSVQPITSAGPTPSSPKPGCSRFTQLGKPRDNPRCGNHQLESRMRENRTYGSEGGEAKSLPDPIESGVVHGLRHERHAFLIVLEIGIAPLRREAGLGQHAQRSEERR